MADDEWVDDEDLLTEAARYAVKSRQQRDLFMSLAKKAWFKATSEVNLDPQTLCRRKRDATHLTHPGSVRIV